MPPLGALPPLLLLSVSVCAQGVGGSAPHVLPWPVSCPSRCLCYIKPWISPDSVYHEVPTVECDDLLLSRLPAPLPASTHTLRLQTNLLLELDAAALLRLPNLTDLDLSQNRFSCVRMITRNLSLTALLSLHLEENRLSLLPDASFSSLPALQELFLSHNKLRSIAAGAFAGLRSLLRLHINNNRLATVDPRWFRALPRLELLMLGENPVEVLPERGFLALTSLRSLVLGGMGLRRLTEKALEGLGGLESLSFYDNLLTQVPTGALRTVTGLRFLDLNKNPIKLIDTGDFQNMVHLKELGLSNMEELVSIERAALENLPELTKLEITNNPRLSHIHPQAFLQLSRLESLMLSSNALSALHQQVALSLPSLRELDLHANPLRCDCLFHWAAADGPRPLVDRKRASPKVRFLQPQATVCADPPELTARRLSEVSAREMSAACLPTIPPGSLPAHVSVREGGTLVLHCRALADPRPELFWLTPSGLRVPNQREAPRPPSTRCRLLPEGTLEIRKITWREAGTYTCIAQNALGADTRSVAVAVDGGRKGRRGAAAVRPEVRLEVVEVGRRSAVLSWRRTNDLPSTRLSWQPLNADTPTYSTRVLGGARSFNLSYLRAETFYRVCLHTGPQRVGVRSGGRKPRCVSFRTKDAAPPHLQLSRDLTSTGATLLLLALILLLLLTGRGGGATAGEHLGGLDGIV